MLLCERTEIPDAVRGVRAPPTPTVASQYHMRLVDPDADAEMLSEWMNRQMMSRLTELLA